jgi:DNA-binding MarR family transcriptional regulator
VERLLDVHEAGEHRVSIPYAPTLADMIPPLALRLRRDFGLLLGLIKAHAILHQVTRKRDKLGRIVATLDDYAAVYELVADLIGEALQATVSTAIRETVAAVAMLLQGDKQEVCVKDVAEKLGLDRSATSRRVTAAEQAGYLRNVEPQKGRAKRLVLGEPLPADQEVLPTPEALDAVCRCAGVTGGMNIPLPPPPAESESFTRVEAATASAPEDGDAHV